MRKEMIKKVAEICEADENQLIAEISQYGIRDFFVRLDFLDYPDATKQRLRDVQKLIDLTGKEGS